MSELFTALVMKRVDKIQKLSVFLRLTKKIVVGLKIASAFSENYGMGLNMNV